MYTGSPTLGLQTTTPTTAATISSTFDVSGLGPIIIVVAVIGAIVFAGVALAIIFAFRRDAWIARRRHREIANMRRHSGVASIDVRVISEEVSVISPAHTHDRDSHKTVDLTRTSDSFPPFSPKPRSPTRKPVPSDIPTSVTEIYLEEQGPHHSAHSSVEDITDSVRDRFYFGEAIRI